MGWRVRKSIKLGKGARLNFGKRGTSLSLGGKGFTYNLSKRGGRATVGVPVTGISYQSKHHKTSIGPLIALVAVGFVLWLIFS
ncbi:MAG: DUF4236 domain-containing protein [Proteobacteria bacterium]|nr:DUF4236 domain-containing protein [Pseudomonadota bacterium]